MPLLQSMNTMLQQLTAASYRHPVTANLVAAAAAQTDAVDSQEQPRPKEDRTKGMEETAGSLIPQFANHLYDRC